MFNFSSIAQEHKKETLLEGKWRIMDWTYVSNVGRGLDKKEKGFLSQGLKDLIMDFSTDSIFTTNRPEVFGSNNVKYELVDSKYLILNDYVSIFILKNQKRFLIRSNIIFEIKKIENYQNSKIILDDNTNPISDLPELLETESIPMEETFTLRELDTLPKLKSPDDFDCDRYCLKNIFNNELLLNFDYSKLKHNDIMFIIDFVVDKKGSLNSFDIKEMHYYWDEEGLNVEHISEKNNGVFTETKKDIIVSILNFRNKLQPALKDNKAVNSRINLKLRLISE